MSGVYVPPFRVEEVTRGLEVEHIDYGTKLVGADKVWSMCTGRGVKVAILDTGIDTGHKDLKPNIAVTKSFIEGEAVLDKHGHGTHTAGICAASRNNQGIIGVAPNASLYIGKVLNNNGTGTLKSVNEGLKWCIEQKVNIISLSLGTTDEIPFSYEQTFKKAYDAGIIMVVSAGNDGKGDNTLTSFAKLPYTISVGAVGSDKLRASFSSTGKQLDYVGPGVSVYSCWPTNSYAVLSGTSMSTPCIAGAIALYVEKKINETGKAPTTAEAIKALNEVCEDIGAKGFDEATGNGLVHIDRMFNQLEPVKKYWRAQTGVFSSSERAYTMRDKLKADGIDAIVVRVETLYKVQVGAFLSKDNAIKMANILKDKGYNTYITYY